MTASEHTNTSLNQLEKTLHAVSEFNRICVREKDRHALIRKVCHNFIDNLGFSNAWIILMDKEGNHVVGYDAGIDVSFDTIQTCFKERDYPPCIRHVLEHNSLTVITAPMEECRECRFLEKDHNKTVLTSRLEFDQKLYGVLCLSKTDRKAILSRERYLVGQLAEDIAFILKNIDLEEQQKEDAFKLHELREILDDRIKELDLLYSISRFMDRDRYSLEETLQEIVSFIPSGFHYPEQACARIQINGEKFETENFSETCWTMSSPILVDENELGHLEVFYLEEKPEEDEGPFFQEEHILLNTIAERVGKIVQRKQASLMLKQNEENFRTLVENAPFGISIISEDQLLYRNPENDKILGTMPMIFSLEAQEYIHPDDRERVLSFYRKIAHDPGQKEDLEFRFLPHADKTSPKQEKLLLCKASSVFFNNIPALLVTIIDRTRSKELERMISSIDKMSSLGRVAAGIAHEIRNPLSGINIYVSSLEKLLEKPESLDRAEEIIVRIKSASERIEAVIKRVIDFAKPGVPALTRTDINATITDALELSAVTMRKSGVTIKRNLAEGIKKCFADKQLITQVVLNLVNNAADALRHGKGEKVVEISSHDRGDCVEIKVTDTGPGIPGHLDKKIFEPYYTTKEGGTGIGLSISQRIVNDHGGSLTVGNAPKRGAEFSFFIPYRHQ